MSEVLSIEEAAQIVKLSKRQLYRVAERGNGPFFKLENRWRVYEDELHNWVRSHKPTPRAEVDPMPLPRRRGSSFRSKVVELRRAS